MFVALEQKLQIKMVKINDGNWHRHGVKSGRQDLAQTLEHRFELHRSTYTWFGLVFYFSIYVHLTLMRTTQH